MKNSRRDFLKNSVVAGTGLFGANMMSCSNKPVNANPFTHHHTQIFNMSGYAAPKLDVVRIGVVGIGQRGTGTVSRLACIEGVEIKALCDLEPERVKIAAGHIGYLGHKPDFYYGHEDEWKKMCERPDIDLIAIVTPWHLHTPMCKYAMENDKHAYTELPAATTIEECWQLVETSERTRKHCVQMSSGAGASILNMVREGYFGELIHAEGCYIHDLLLTYNFTHRYHNHWRLKANIGRNGNLYPQHGMVPIMQYMDVNCGDQLDYLSSISSNDFLMGKTAENLATEDDVWKPYVGKNFRGNMNVTIIRTMKGRTIVLQHDVTSPRPRGGSCLSGTKAILHQRRLATSHENWLSEEEFREINEQYTPEVTRRFHELRKDATLRDHGNNSPYRITYDVDWRLIDCLRNGIPMDRDVYEAATSSVITPLSIWSTSNRSNSITVPDFTNGKWQTNARGVDINFTRGGGSTKLLVGSY
jgi:hypothetical protein